MTEKLSTGMLSINTTKQTKLINTAQFFSNRLPSQAIPCCSTLLVVSQGSFPQIVSLSWLKEYSLTVIRQFDNDKTTVLLHRT